MEIGLLPGERLDYVNEHLSLIQKTDGLTFGTDALLLAGFFRAQKDGAVAELGGGSGIISMLLSARNKCKTAVIAEVQPEYAALCRRNVLLNGLAERVTVVEGDVRDAGLLPAGAFDAVVTNPPYLPAGSGPENENPGKNIARREVMGGIADFCRAAEISLKYGGSFFCVYRPERLAELFAALRACHLEPKRLTSVMADPDHEPILFLVEAKKGGHPGLRVTRPFYLYRAGTRENSPEMQTLLETGNIQ